ncbi:type II toxin-antitoxin system VapC family toxin [Nostoc sp. 'Lobaria pulmonaria (5183) cyanobiont']|uniref:type II toxin-antitoxin system VapC family toxin n=1 Tax=Nostoc sp. 'Lobaria pulmonaria (5183) cyanobiont' TaxID=1618022 RepID=UPI000D0C1999|nr:PIN domain-containing protein [Nostoc sp. 'Lobaria pulmonaria (5183) cyanobiont']AVH71085.1 PIN domain protein [Nostoc sp. 'Lobaria pulmonaria (5183) cyanobiont']
MMRRCVLLDTGPLVAVINRSDKFYGWTTTQWANIEPPLLTCEAVISEACFLLKKVYGGQEAVINLVKNGVINIPFKLDEEAIIIGELVKTYQSVPMSLADACLVRMSEQHIDSFLLTFDSDFLIYRRDKNQIIPVIMP